MSQNESFPNASENSAEETCLEAGGGDSFRINAVDQPVRDAGISPYVLQPEETEALAPEDCLPQAPTESPNIESDFAPECDLTRAEDTAEWTGDISTEICFLDLDETPSEIIYQPDPFLESFVHPRPDPPRRIPHIGHLCILATLGLFGVISAIILMFGALLIHLFGVTSVTKATTEVHYMLGTEAVIYLATFALSLFIFPLFWNKSFFEGIHWRGSDALKLGWRLPAISVFCFALAALDETLIPGPENAPIDDIFRAPGAAWLLFAFGVTIAPFFEEMIFRGFLLPAFATAYDWLAEHLTRQPPPPLDENGHPEWSLPAMVVASILTSLPFALMHAEQTANAIGPFVLLLVVSLILCAVRLKTRSLAASTVVHACYNFLIFSLMLIGTGGFRHLDKM